MNLQLVCFFCFVNQMVRIEKLKIGNTFENPKFVHSLSSYPGNFLLSHCFSQKAETSHSLSQARAVSLGHWQIQPKKSVVVFQACIIQQCPHRNVNIKLSTKIQTKT